DAGRRRRGGAAGPGRRGARDGGAARLRIPRCRQDDGAAARRDRRARRDGGDGRLRAPRLTARAGRGPGPRATLTWRRFATIPSTTDGLLRGPYIPAPHGLDPSRPGAAVRAGEGSAVRPR